MIALNQQLPAYFLQNMDFIVDLDRQIKSKSLRHLKIFPLHETVKKEPSIIISEIASILNLADRTIKRAIDFLKKGGLIKRIGSTKSVQWGVEFL